MIRIVAGRAGLLVCACLAMPAEAMERIADPTRPPTASDNAQDVAMPVLQSVLIAPGRSEAIISGRLVRVGDQFGDGRVVKIVETEVVIRSGNESQTLKLFPSIEKRPAALRSVAAKPGSRGQEK